MIKSFSIGIGEIPWNKDVATYVEVEHAINQAEAHAQQAIDTLGLNVTNHGWTLKMTVLNFAGEPLQIERETNGKWRLLFNFTKRKWTTKKEHALVFIKDFMSAGIIPN